MIRTPLGDGTVHIGDGFAANAGRVEFGSPENGGVGQNITDSFFVNNPTFGSENWPIYPPTPASKNVDPIIAKTEFFDNFPSNHPDRFKGIQEGEL